MNTIYNLIEELNNELRILANEKYDEYRKTILKDYSNYISIDLSKWNTLQKENLLINILEGIHYYYFIYSNKKSFPITSFNEVYNVINGQKTIYIYKKSIPYFSIKTIKLLLEEG
ncbi:MAG: hypothetical protein KDD29_08835, partial [Flavobacteriales bacterium]|nr:hypothetical protein [Flavobacteriales bacterium]